MPAMKRVGKRTPGAPPRLYRIVIKIVRNPGTSDHDYQAQRSLMLRKLQQEFGPLVKVELREVAAKTE